MGNVFFERFAALCKEHNETPNSVAKVIGASSGSVTAWKKGTAPRNNTLAKIADYFNVTTDYLLGIDDDTRLLDSASNKLDKMVLEDPSLPSGKRIEFLFDSTGFDPAIVSYNLEIDPQYIHSWITNNDIPPRPIANKIIGVFHKRPLDIFNGKELVSYYLESREWGDSIIQEDPSGITRGTQDSCSQNIILVAGRNGSFQKRGLSDAQLAVIVGMLDQMPDASDDL